MLYDEQVCLVLGRGKGEGAGGLRAGRRLGKERGASRVHCSPVEEDAVASTIASHSTLPVCCVLLKAR